MKRLIQLEGMGRVIGHIFLLLILFLGAKGYFSEKERQFSRIEEKYERKLRSLYGITGIALVKLSASVVLWDGHSLWVANDLYGLVQQIDPWEGRVVAELEVGGRPSALAWDGVSLWVAGGGDFIQQIDV